LEWAQGFLSGAVIWWQCKSKFKCTAIKYVFYCL